MMVSHVEPAQGVDIREMPAIENVIIAIPSTWDPRASQGDRTEQAQAQ